MNMTDRYAAAYEVGKYYLVPCVRGQYFGVVADWPVIGPMHEDAEYIKFKWHHYHIDWRFVPHKLFRPLGYKMGALLLTNHISNPIGLPAPVLRRRKMYRPFQKFIWPATMSDAYKKFAAAYSESKLSSGMVCPHRGLPLQGCPQDGDVVTCPGHGLRWNVITGELVK